MELKLFQVTLKSNCMEEKILRDIVHIVGHIVIYSLLLWQIVLGVYILLVWANKNWKIKNIIQSPNNNQSIQPVINIDGSSIENSNKSKNMGPIEVDVSKNTIIDTKSDEASVKLDEKIKGKVKTQKDKLRKLRR